MPASNLAAEAPDSCLRKGVSLNFKILTLIRKTIKQNIFSHPLVAHDLFWWARAWARIISSKGQDLYSRKHFLDFFPHGSP